LYPIERGTKGHKRPSIGGVPRKARLPAKHPALKRLGGRIRQLRERRELSQETLADVAKIARSYMSGIERGVRNCSALHLLRIARALHVGVGDLFP
jgi:DNA-binding XRE family transcriptional regulator